MSDHEQSDLEDPYKFRVASEIVDLLSFCNTGAGRPRDIVRKMRIVIETYCTATYPDSFDSDDTLMSIVAKIRTTGEQHPACALLDELDDIHNYSWDHCRDDAPNRDLAGALDVKELTGFVRRTLKIVKAIPNLA
jgi:hypothetical protein